MAGKIRKLSEYNKFFGREMKLRLKGKGKNTRSAVKKAAKAVGAKWRKSSKATRKRVSSQFRRKARKH
jgi:hypothetical protein